MDFHTDYRNFSECPTPQAPSSRSGGDNGVIPGVRVRGGESARAGTHTRAGAGIHGGAGSTSAGNVGG